MGQDGAGEREQEPGRSHERLPVAAQKGGHERVHGDQHDRYQQPQRLQHGPLVPYPALRLDAHAGVPREQLRDELAVDSAPRLDGGDHRRVRSRCHRRGPFAVDAHQRRLFTVLGQVRDHRQRHLAAACPADTLAGQFAQIAPPLPRIPHHDLQLFVAALNSLDLHAVEVGAQLRPYRGRRQSRRLPPAGVSWICR